MSQKTLAALAGALIIAACGDASQDGTEEIIVDEPPRAVVNNEEPEPSEIEEPVTLRDVLENDARLTTLVAALDASGLLMTLEEEGPLTIFAPNNAAFAALPASLSLDVLTAEENKAVLRDLLAYHVISGHVTSADLQGSSTTRSAVNGDPLSIDAVGPVISVEGAVVVISDLEADNGVVHVIDTVLLPLAN